MISTRSRSSPALGRRDITRSEPCERRFAPAGAPGPVVAPRARVPDGLDAVLARAVDRRAAGAVSHAKATDGPVLQRIRDPDVTAGAKEADESQLTAKVIVKGFAASDITYMHKVLYKAGETVGTLKSLLANNYPMSYATVGRKAGLTAPLLTQADGAALTTSIHTVTINVPSDARDTVLGIPEAAAATEKMQLKYLKLYELGQLGATTQLKALLDQQPADDPLWILPASTAFTIGDVKNVQEIAGRADLTPMLQIGDVYASMTLTGSGTWPGIVRKRFNAPGADRATDFTVFTGTHGNIGGQKLNPEGTHWEADAGTKAGAADFPAQDRARAAELLGELGGCSIKVVDVWDKAGRLIDPTTGTRGDSTDPDNMLVEPAKLKAAVRAELAAGRVVIMAWCYSVEAFNVARFAGAPVPAAERSGASAGPLPSETDYVAARNAVPLNTIVNELFDGGAGAWTRTVPAAAPAKKPAPKPAKKWAPVVIRPAYRTP